MGVDVLEGLLLSDGCLQRARRSVRWHYEQTCREPTLLCWAVSQLPSSGTVRGPYGASGYFRVRTHVHGAYGDARARWYREGRKIIPDDFAVTPTAMLAAYLGDGSLRTGVSGRLVRLSMCAFTRVELDRVVADLIGCGFDAGVHRLRAPYHEVVVRARSVVDFLRWIGPCPVPAYSYKWALRERMLDAGQAVPLTN